MYCPRCGEPQPLGTRRCSSCGTPFTRRESERRRAPVPAAASTQTRSRGSRRTYYQTWERGPSGGRRLLTWLAVFVAVAVFIVVAVTILSTAVVRPLVGREATEQLQGKVGARIAEDLPTIEVPAATGGEELVLTQDDLNAQIASHADQLGPLDDVSIQITPEEMIVDMSAYGVNGRYRANVEARDGQVAVTGGRMDGPLGWVVPTGQLESTLNGEIGDALARTGVSVQSVRLEQGQMVLNVVPR